MANDHKVGWASTLSAASGFLCRARPAEPDGHLPCPDDPRHPRRDRNPQYAAAAVIVFFMRLADFIEGYTMERSRQAIRELLKLAPETARVERDGAEREIAAEEVARGEIVLVKPGERIPVDGTVVGGRASVNQAPITGESIPLEKQAGDQVFAATICERGALQVRTERVGRDTTFGQIIRLVEEAEASKAPVQRFADRFTGYYIPVVIAVAAATYLASGNATAAVATVLVACSCAIAMATPITVLAAVGQAARRGIVVKGGRYLEALAKVDTVVMDKTGTLTIGRPEVTDVIPLDGRPAKRGSAARRSDSSAAPSTRSRTASCGPRRRKACRWTSRTDSRCIRVRGWRERSAGDASGAAPRS